MKLEKKRALVIGMGRSGIAAAEALMDAGAEVSIYDRKCMSEFEPRFIERLKSGSGTLFLGNCQETADTELSDAGNASSGSAAALEEGVAKPELDLVVMSPGISPELPFIAELAKAGAEVIGELELAYRMGKGRYVGITGTNGKTTTTILTGEIFRSAGRKTEVVGNVGTPVVSRAVDADRDTWMVTEISSFQLETIRRFHPVVSALLNVTPDHLDRHGTMENYADTKGKIFENQTCEDYFVFNYDDPQSRRQAARCKAARKIPFSRREVFELGCFAVDGQILIRDEDGDLIDICGVEELQIPGTHNLENALAAAAISYFSGIDPDVIGAVLRSFQGVEHRIEFVKEIDGVRFVNDSKGTNPDAAIKAIEAIRGNIRLIAGGYDKGSSYENFVEAFGSKVKGLYLLGVTAPKIRDTAERLGYAAVTMACSMKECVEKAFADAEPGDTVLLSPACASWDMYQSYERRGEDFKTCVSALKK